MKTLILAGGKGTRLQPLTLTVPKPLLPVGDRSILEILLERLAAAGLRDVVLSVGYQAPLVRAFCGDGSQFGVHIEYVEEREPLGTAGPLKLLEGSLDPDEELLVINGDVVTDLDFRKLLDFHRSSGSDLTVCYVEQEERSPFGVLTLDGERITGIVEKPTHVFPVSAGIYLVNARLIERIPDKKFYTFPELVTQLLRDGEPVGAFRVEAFWLGIERFSHFDEALAALEKAQR